MFEIGRVCLKTAGRDAGKFGVVIAIDDSRQFVMLDGYVRRRKVNIKHVEPTSVVVKIKEGASTEEVLKALEEAGFKERAPKNKYSKSRMGKPLQREAGEDTKSKNKAEKKSEKKQHKGSIGKEKTNKEKTSQGKSKNKPKKQ